MAACRIVNEEVKKAVDELTGYSNEYKSAGDALVSAFTAAIAEMEGASKDALLEFFNKEATSLVKESVPEAVKTMATLLEANRSNFEDIDQKIAQSISSGK